MEGILCIFLIENSVFRVYRKCIWVVVKDKFRKGNSYVLKGFVCFDSVVGFYLVGMESFCCVLNTIGLND